MTLLSSQIGSFEHNLTTDLLNHLVFLQKVFMKEVNEVIQKVSGWSTACPGFCCFSNVFYTSVPCHQPGFSKLLLTSEFSAWRKINE